MSLPLRRVGSGAGHHHLDAALSVIVIVPAGAQPRQFVVEVNADAAAHAHRHRLSFQGLQALFEVVNYVRGNLLYPVFGADDGFQLRPLGFEPFLALDFLALGGLLEVRVNGGPLGVSEF